MPDIVWLFAVVAVHLATAEASRSCSHLGWPQKPFCEKYPLHWAATAGNVDEIKRLLGDGADINQKTGGGYTGQTPLHIGGRYGRSEVVRLLIRNGADETITNNAGEKPLARARIQFCSQNSRNTWCTLAASDYTVTLALLQDGCAASGCNTGFSCIARHCQQVKTSGSTSRTRSSCGPHVWFWWSAQRCRDYPFHWSAVVGDETEVTRFLQQQNNVNLRDRDRYTLLMLAAWAGRAGTVSLLLNHGADITLTNARGRTALILANKRFCSDPSSKGCSLGDVNYNETIRLLRQGSSSSGSSSSSHAATTTTTTGAVTRTGIPCVRFMHWGAWYESSSCVCCWRSKSWCATSASSQGHMDDWDYCNTTG